ncbi:MAG: acetoin dehydrogenase dihydrolipoyllysine-residue acetyltransferase subunit [Ancalomicrobiaceae bacterium]|nr:acetoin dehydrogenase dihydrolipoyllysine-residue acetyltransferase subunit [Ancalomicrobiaceae bacterium]
MPTEIILPRVDMDMATGRISAWLADDGAIVAKGEPIFEIETDKAAMEIDAPETGVLKHGGIALGIDVAVGTPVGWIFADGEAIVVPDVTVSGAATGADGSTNEAMTPDVPDEPTAGAIVDGTASVAGSDTGAVRATPLARRLAREAGIDLATVANGSGPNGRIQAADIEARASSAPAFASPSSVSGAGIHLQRLRNGEGRPIVLLHGFAADLDSWRPFLGLGLTGRPVIGLDLPGHGRSAGVAATDLADMVARVAARLATEGLTDIDLAGHSLGGAVAAELAGQAGGRVKSLFLIAPAGLGPEINGGFVEGFLKAREAQSIAAWMRLLVADSALISEKMVAETAKRRAETGTEALAGLAARLFADSCQGFDIRPTLSSLTIPVRVAFGLADRIIPAHQTRGLPPQVALHLFPGLGHMPHWEAGEIVLELLRQTVASAA